MNVGMYILDGHTPVPTSDTTEWALMLEGREARVVARDEVSGYLVSTVFLGLDHSFGLGGPPLLFETMAFAAPGSGDEMGCERYATWEAAEAGHRRMLARVRQAAGLVE